MEAYELVESALESLGFKDDYFKIFVDNEVDDLVVRDCLTDSKLITALENVIPPAGRRIKFLKKFSELVSEKTINAVTVPQHVINAKEGSVVEDILNVFEYEPVSSPPIEELMLFTSTAALDQLSLETDRQSTSEVFSCVNADQPSIVINPSVDHHRNGAHVEPVSHLEVPHPVQIMNFRESTEEADSLGMDFYRPNLEKIVLKTGGRPVGVLVIAGPTRKGKSFYMNYVLRYLVGLAEDDADWMGWARSKDPLVGFPWETSSDRITTGIWMWSEPITVKSKDGREYDILLMDTQGVFDEHTTPQQWSVLVGLGLISSSCLIFNLSSDLQEDQLNVFDNFLQFGLLALQDQTNGPESNVETPFQKLVFLIRDWSNTQQHPFGSTGGKSFIQRKLEIKPHHKDAHKRVREQLSQCFEEVNCFLLPNPGPAAFELDYNGATGNCYFYLAELEKTILELMNPLEFPLKKLNGNYLTGQDYLAHFTLYCNLLSSAEMPSSELFYDIASRSCNSVVINKCIDRVSEELQQILVTRPFFHKDVLLQLQEELRGKAIDIFASCKKMGTRDSIEQSKQDLLNKITTVFENLYASNALKKDKTISEAMEAALSSYTCKMHENLSVDFHPTDFLESLSIDEEDNATKLFKQLCYLDESEELSEYSAKLSRLFRQKLDTLQNANTLKRIDAYKKLESEIEKIASAYKSEMEFKTDGTIISDEELHQMHASTRQKCLVSFAALEPHHLLLADAQESLEEKINVYFEAIGRCVQTCNENIQMVGDQLKAAALKQYMSRMRASMGIKETDFASLHSQFKKQVINTVDSSDRIKSKKCMQVFLRKLDSEIEDAYCELCEELYKQLQDLKNNRNASKNEALKIYSDSMNKLLRDANQSPIEDLKLESRHEYAHSEASAFLQSFFDDLHEKYRDNEEERLVFNEFCEELSQRFKHFQENNKLRWDKFEFESRNILSKIKEGYVTALRSAIEESFDDEDFLKAVTEAQRDSRSLLLQQIDTNLAKPDFYDSLQEELSCYLENQFDSVLQVFKMKQEEDKIQIKAAFAEGKNYYNEEMDKITKEQEWFPPEVLKQKSEEKMSAAIEMCKEEVELTDHQEKHLRECMKNLFVKYWNENLKRYPRESYSVGIDLGTTYSCVAVYMNNQVKVIECLGRPTIPSVVAFNDDRGVDVGEEAKAQFYRHPENTIFDAKRLIGRKFTDESVQEDVKLWPFNVKGDENNQPRIQVRGMELRPEEISARVLAKLKGLAEAYLLKPVLEAVVTVPAYFNDAQRQATRDAAVMAGLKVRILNEPTAAAIAYGLDSPDAIQRNVLIFDLGGGTFDVAILQMKGGSIQVKATGGNTHLGGEDFDNEMVKYVIEHVKEKDKIDLGRDRKSNDEFKKRKAFARLGRIRHYCEQQKRLLSSAERMVISIDRIDENYDLDVTFTRELFEQLNMARFRECISLMSDTLKDSKLDKSDIDDIVLVGGSTRIPKIKEMIRSFFNNKTLNIRINPDEAVARGAAVQAAILNGKQALDLATRLTLSDVAPLSVGVEVVTGDLSVVIPKNTPVPCTRSEIYHTACDNQTAANIKVYEGEMPMAVDNNFLGKFLLSNIPKAPRGQEPIDIYMTVDEEGILHVQAVSRSGRSTNSIDIETYNGRMTKSDISKVRRTGLFKW